MRKINKIISIALILMLGGCIVFPDVSYGLRVPLKFDIDAEEATRKEKRDAILQKNREGIKYLETLKRIAEDTNTEKVLDALRPSVRKIFEELFKNPTSTLADVAEYNEMLFFELYTVLYSRWGYSLIKKYPEIFNSLKESRQKLRGLIERIIQACAFKEADLSEEELALLRDRYLESPYDNEEEQDIL